MRRQKNVSQPNDLRGQWDACAPTASAELVPSPDEEPMRAPDATRLICPLGTRQIDRRPARHAGTPHAIAEIVTGRDVIRHRRHGLTRRRRRAQNRKFGALQYIPLSLNRSLSLGG